ncbi:hypothetical protein Tco_0766504 [Tanacetum coccineum]
MESYPDFQDWCSTLAALLGLRNSTSDVYYTKNMILHPETLVHTAYWRIVDTPDQELINTRSCDGAGADTPYLPCWIRRIGAEFNFLQIIFASQSSGAGDEAHIVNANVNANSQGILLTTASEAAFKPTGIFLPSVGTLQGTLPSEGSPLKRSHSSTSTVRNRRTTRFRHASAGHDTSGHIEGVSYVYDDLGDCD